MAKKKKEFEIGDRVKFSGPVPECLRGQIGTVKGFLDDTVFAVEFDNPFSLGTACMGYTKDDYGWFCAVRDIDRQDEK